MSQGFLCFKGLRAVIWTCRALQKHILHQKLTMDRKCGIKTNFRARKYEISHSFFPAKFRGFKVKNFGLKNFQNKWFRYLEGGIGSCAVVQVGVEDRRIVVQEVQRWTSQGPWKYRLHQYLLIESELEVFTSLNRLRQCRNKLWSSIGERIYMWCWL